MVLQRMPRSQKRLTLPWLLLLQIQQAQFIRYHLLSILQMQTYLPRKSVFFVGIIVLAILALLGFNGCRVTDILVMQRPTTLDRVIHHCALLVNTLVVISVPQETNVNAVSTK